jgi:DNA-binding IclR family transcriptional regulator
MLEEDFAVNNEECAAGLYAIAAPVHNEAREVVAALNLAADASTMSLEDPVDALGILRRASKPPITWRPRNGVALLHIGRPSTSTWHP